MNDDRAAVIETQIGYADACDSRDWSILERVFTEDASGTYGLYNPPDRRGFEAMLSSFLDGAGPTQHMLGNHVVELDGDIAHARCTVTATHGGRPGSGREQETYVVYGSYHDDLVRVPHGWLIRHRRMIVDLEVGDRRLIGSA